MNADERRATWRGFGDGMTQAVEMAVMPVLFGLLGLALDGWRGTKPVFLVAFVTLAAAGSFARAYYAFQAAAERADEGKPWARR